MEYHEHNEHTKHNEHTSAACPRSGHQGELALSQRMHLATHASFIEGGVALAQRYPRFGHEGELALWRYNERRNIPRTFLPCPLDLHIPFADVPFFSILYIQ